jgi:ubiquinone/menaquinone biosynthesis C-methylase UbiE
MKLHRPHLGLRKKFSEQRSKHAKPDVPLPPLEYQELVCGPATVHEFASVGQYVTGLLDRQGMTGPGTDFLDVGCGCGRVARCLMAKPLDSYVGFDRHPGMIQWCTDELTSRDSRFTFQHLDIKSAYVDWDGHAGQIDATTATFPFADASFDSVLLASVLTHMPLDETRQYLSELRRVIRPEGQILASVFLSTDEPRRESINFLYLKPEFFSTVKQACLQARLVEGSEPVPGDELAHTWYLLTAAA